MTYAQKLEKKYLRQASNWEREAYQLIRRFQIEEAKKEEKQKIAAAIEEGFNRGFLAVTKLLLESKQTLEKIKKEPA